MDNSSSSCYNGSARRRSLDAIAKFLEGRKRSSSLSQASASSQGSSTPTNCSGSSVKQRLAQNIQTRQRQQKQRNETRRRCSLPVIPSEDLRHLQSIYDEACNRAESMDIPTQEEEEEPEPERYQPPPVSVPEKKKVPIESIIQLLKPSHEVPGYFCEFTLHAPVSYRHNALVYANKSHSYWFDVCWSSNVQTNSLRTVFTLCVDDPQYKEPKLWRFWKKNHFEMDPNLQSLENCLFLDAEPKSTISVKSLAFNSVETVWLNPNINGGFNFRLQLTFNLLSTDFTPKKGVKGPIFVLLADSYDQNGQLLDRSLCQLRVFSDKGAERKLRDELKAIKMPKNGEKRSKISSYRFAKSLNFDFEPFKFQVTPYDCNTALSMDIQEPLSSNSTTTSGEERSTPSSTFSGIQLASFQTSPGRQQPPVVDLLRDYVDSSSLDIDMNDFAAMAPEQPTLTIYVRSKDEMVSSPLQLPNFNFSAETFFELIKTALIRHYRLVPFELRSVAIRFNNGLTLDQHSVAFSSATIWQMLNQSLFFVHCECVPSSNSYLWPMNSLPPLVLSHLPNLSTDYYNINNMPTFSRIYDLLLIQLTGTL